MNVELFIIDIIEGKRKIPLLRGALYGLSFLFQIGVKTRSLFYRVGIFKTRSLPCPVISIGNLVAGGTGKTPFIKALIEELFLEKGKGAVLCRGYRSKLEKQQKSFLLSEGMGPKVLPVICGDEPYWLASHTNAQIVVGKDRMQSGLLAIDKGAELLILDDGFQHKQLQRDVDIVLLDSTDLFGKGYFLPRGYLRDSPSKLREADVVVVTRLEQSHCREEIERAIRLYTKAPLVGFAAAYELDKQMVGTKAGAFCGIAKPSGFYRALETLGIEVVDTKTSSDHKIPSACCLQAFAKHCTELGALSLICTEKDYVKIIDVEAIPLPIYPLKMKFTCVWNENSWKEIKQSIRINKTNLK